MDVGMDIDVDDDDTYCGDYDSDVDFIKIFDSSVTYILCKAEAVKMYLLYTESDTGELDCEFTGDCYVYIRDEEPKHFLIIINQYTEKFLREPIIHELFWDIQNPMLLYKKEDVVYSIVFETRDDYLNITGIVASILESIPDPVVKSECYNYDEFDHTPSTNDPSTKENKPTSKVTPTQINMEDVEKLVKLLSMEEQSDPNAVLIAPINVGDYTTYEFNGLPLSYLRAIKPVGKIDKEKMVATLADKEKSTDIKVDIEMKEELREDVEHGVGEGGPLNQSQLIQALIFMLKNNSDFIKKVHEEYIKNFKK